MEDRTCTKVQVQVKSEVCEGHVQVSEREGKVFDLEVKSKVCERQVKVKSQVFELEAR